jgi:ubiquinone/menaquinone biosynthesis C-methylase UbiE
MALPFPRESIDFSFSRAIIEHLENPSDFAKELHRVAKRGSLSIFTLFHSQYTVHLKIFIGSRHRA